MERERLTSSQPWESERRDEIWKIA